MTVPDPAQYMPALGKANQRRLAVAARRRWIAALERDEARRVVAALLRKPDEVAKVLTVQALVGAISRMGPGTYNPALAAVSVNPMSKVGQLTPRQAEAVAHWVLHGIIKGNGLPTAAVLRAAIERHRRRIMGVHVRPADRDLWEALDK